MSELWTVILAGIAVAAISYLLGSINTAILVSRSTKFTDIRNYGSGNAGMTNMLRTFGKGSAAVTFIGDFLKGSVAVILGRLIFGWLGIDTFDIGYVAGIFVMIGHIFPVFFGFRGGKGIATALGGMLVLNWLAFLAIASALLPMMFIIRIVSAVTLTGAALYPVLTALVLYLQKAPLEHMIPAILSTLLISGLAFYAHRENIARLMNGTENRFILKKKNEEGKKTDGG